MKKKIKDKTHILQNRYTTIVQFSGQFKYTVINQYDPICTINNCHFVDYPDLSG